MTPTLAPCHPYPWPHAECVREHRKPPTPRLPADDRGLTVDHGDTQTAADLAAIAGAITGAFIGGSVLLGYGLLERLFRKRP